MLLDNVWMREFSDLERVTDTRAMVPLNLFANAHAQFRTAIELGFSTRIGDAWNLLRSAIESAVYAAKIWREPDLAIVWAAKETANRNLRRSETPSKETRRNQSSPQSMDWSVSTNTTRHSPKKARTRVFSNRSSTHCRTWPPRPELAFGVLRE